MSGHFSQEGIGRTPLPGGAISTTISFLAEDSKNNFIYKTGVELE